jgi:hypothetical protein
MDRHADNFRWYRGTRRVNIDEARRDIRALRAKLCES